MKDTIRRIINEEMLLQRLNAVTNAWKNQFETPALPLNWEIKDNIVFLDGIWIAPAQFIVLQKLEWCAEQFYPIGFEISLTDGILDVIIIQEDSKFELHAIERHILAGKEEKHDMVE